MSPERILAKDIKSNKYVLLVANTSKCLPETLDRLIWIYEKYPTIEFNITDVSKIEAGLFNMRTFRNSRQLNTYRVLTQDDDSSMERYTVATYQGDIITSDVRTLAVCQKVALESFCNNYGYEVIQRF